MIWPHVNYRSDCSSWKKRAYNASRTLKQMWNGQAYFEIRSPILGLLGRVLVENDQWGLVGSVDAHLVCVGDQGAKGRTDGLSKRAIGRMYAQTEDGLIWHLFDLCLK